MLYAVAERTSKPLVVKQVITRVFFNTLFFMIDRTVLVRTYGVTLQRVRRGYFGWMATLSEKLTQQDVWRLIEQSSLKNDYRDTLAVVCNWPKPPI